MPRKRVPFLRDVTFFSENLQAPLYGHETPREGEDSGVYYAAVGADAEVMKGHLKSQRASPLWRRLWSCDPENPYAIKVIAFPYRSVAENAMAIYSALDVPSSQSVGRRPAVPAQGLQPDARRGSGRPRSPAAGHAVGAIQDSLRRHRDDEITKCLQDPQSAREACWLLNARDTLYGRNVVAKVGELPWSVRVTEWENPARQSDPQGRQRRLFRGRMAVHAAAQLLASLRQSAADPVSRPAPLLARRSGARQPRQAAKGRLQRRR